MKLTHATTIEQIKRSTVAELREAIASYGEVPQGKNRKTTTMKKFQLVEQAKNIVKTLSEAHQAQQERIEHERQTQRQIEKPQTDPIYEAIQNRIAKERATHVSAITDFQSRVSGSSLYAAYEVKRFAEDIMYRDQVVRELALLSKFFKRQQKLRTFTEMLEILDDEIEDRLRRCLEDDYRHNSTDAMSNLENIAKFQAYQSVTKLLRGIAKILADGSSEMIVMQIEHLHIY